MNHAMTSMSHHKSIKADVWRSPGVDRAILTFQGSHGQFSLHIPPSVAQATADAFNKAMAENEGEKA